MDVWQVRFTAAGAETNAEIAQSVEWLSTSLRKLCDISASAAVSLYIA
ncbi:MAG: hypothetical protein WCB68_08535 [Pyrinomonadaceae bacterium]